MNIYEEFTFDDNILPQHGAGIYKEAIILSELLLRKTNLMPDYEWESGWGCPYSDLQIGYWGIKYNIDFIRSV